MAFNRILIADDEQFILDSLARELRTENYLVSCVLNGKEAIRELQKNSFDLVIADLQIPEVNGMELLEEVKKTTPETCVIVLTANADMDSVITALKLGADDYLLKPCGTDELLLQVSRCLEKRSLIRQLKKQNHMLRKEIAQRQQLEAQLRGYAEKTALFSYSVAHDIKIPAISLLGLTKLFIEKFNKLLPEKGRRVCAQILHSAQQIVTLADQINLYVSTKETPFVPERVELKQLVDSIRKEFALQFEDRNINWIESEEMPSLWADRVALQRVLGNCVDNALKYGGDTMHEVAVGYQQTPAFHILSVRNDGIAMTRDECERVFEEFRRGQSSQGSKGTGLGLAIVKELIERHNGKVWAESDGQNGVIFFMSIAKDFFPC